MRTEGATSLELEPIERLEDVREDWSRLAEATGHPFATWEWNDCWWRAFGAGRRLYSFACRDASGSIVAILPLYVATTRPVGVARFLGYADLQSPICAPGDRPAAAEALLRVTRRPHRCRIVIAERLPVDQGWRGLLGGTVYRVDSGPVLRTRGRTWDEFLASKKAKSRSTLRRKEKRLVEQHGLKLRLADDPDRLADDMWTLFRLHRARFGTESTGVFSPRMTDFHLEFAAAALRRGRLRLWLAEVDGAPVAAWYGWRFADTEWFFQSGRDPRFDRLSVGTVLLVHTLREAFNDGVGAYRFLAGDEAYKLQFSEEDIGAESLIVASGALRWIGARSVAIGTALPDPARRRLARLAGRSV